MAKLTPVIGCRPSTVVVVVVVVVVVPLPSSTLAVPNRSRL